MRWTAVPCFFLLGLSFFFVSADNRCRTEVNIPGKALKGFVFKKMSVTAPHKCDVRCEREITCQSYNYVIDEKSCELNNRTKEARPENFRSDPARFYIKRLNGRVPLGSIPELPAQSCQEIKASEGKDTISNNYWLDPTRTGTAVLVYCDMNLEVYKNCAEIYKAGKRTSGVYTIDPDDAGAFDVFCDQTTAGGGWTVFQKRLDGSVEFYRGWDNYKRGFGNLNGEFWLGLDKIHRLTKERSRLRVDLEDTTGKTAYAEYDFFGVASEGSKYKLSLGRYSGTAGDSLSNHRGSAFSTKDRDNDSYSGSCAMTYTGAWWYDRCHYSNLNGIYHHGKHSSHADGVNWYHWKGHNYSAKRAEMKIKPVKI